MKRSPMPPRRKPMPSGRRPAQYGLPPVERQRRAEVKAVVFAKAGHRCQLSGIPDAGRCFGGLTYHHRRKASQGGKYTVENGAALCAHHNDQLEADADLAQLGVQLGLVLLRA